MAASPCDRSRTNASAMTAGRHAFRLDLVQPSAGRPNLDLTAEGPEMAPRLLTVRDEGRGGRAAGGAGPRVTPILLEPKDHVLVQRSFIPFEPRKRLYG